MKKSRIICPFILVVVSLLVACSSPLAPTLSSANSGAGSQLVLSLNGVSATNNTARTIVPTNITGLVTKYSVNIAKGTESKTVSSTTSPIVIPGFAAGSWSITATGLDASNNPIAQGSTVVVVGTDQIVTASITLAFIQNGGTGGIDLTLTFPHSAGIDSVDMTLAGSAINPPVNIVPVDANTDKVMLTQTNVAAGSPLLQVFLKKAGTVLSGVVESVWVFRNVTTSGTITLLASDFGSPPAAPVGLSATALSDGSLQLGWSNNSIIADAYIVRRATALGGPYVQVGANLPYNAVNFRDSGLISGTTYYYQVTAQNRFGESAALSASATTLNPVSAPVFTPAGGTAVAENQSITIATTTGGASIYYTMTVDGSDPPAPSAASTQYTAPISLSVNSATLKIKAIAVKPGMADSTVTSVGYTVNRKPVISAFTASPTTLLYRNALITLSATATDPEGGSLSYAYSFAAGSGSISGSSAWSTTVGTNTFKVTVTDPAGNTASSTVSVTVLDRAPTVTSITAAAGTIYNNGTDTKTITVVASDPDADALTYSYNVSGPGAVYGNGANAIFVAGNGAGSSIVTVTVNDGNGKTATKSSAAIKTSGWKQILTTMESRIAPAIASRDSDGNLFFFGGQSTAASTLNNDVWMFQPAAVWASINGNQAASATYPSARTRSTAVMVDPSAYDTIMFGGYDGTALLADIWRYNGGLWTKLNPTGTAPPAMDLLNAVSNSDGIAYILGSDGILYLLYVPVQTHNSWICHWQSFPAAALSNRTAYSAVFDGTGVVVFGGLTGGGTSLNDVWKFTLSTSAWTQVSGGGAGGAFPAARYGQSAVYDGSGNMYIFGGNAGGTAMNDIWKFNIATATWTQLNSLNPPLGRFYHKAMYYNGTMIVFGAPTTGDSTLWQYILP